MKHIVTVTVPVSNPVKMEADAYDRYKSYIMVENSIRFTAEEQRQYHEQVAAWEPSSWCPITNGWRRAAREWLEANPK